MKHCRIFKCCFPKYQTASNCSHAVLCLLYTTCLFIWKHAKRLGNKQSCERPESNDQGRIM